MGFVERIGVIIESTADGAIRGLTSTGVAAEGLGAKSRAAQGALALLDRSGLAASTTLGGKLKSSIQESGTVMGGLEQSGIGLGQVIGVGLAAGAAVGGAALAKFAIDGVGAFESATSEVRGLQRTLGDTAEDASRLRFAAKTLGIDIDALSRGAGILGKNIGNGTTKLGDFGVQIARDKEGRVDLATTIGNIAEAYQNAGDQTTKLAIGNAAFGKSYQALIPLLSKSKDEIQALYAEAGKEHQIFNSDDAEQGRQLSVATRELKTEVTGLEIELARALVPALSGAAHESKLLLQGLDALFKVVQEGTKEGGKGAPAFFDSLETVLQKAAYNAGVLSGGLRQLGSEVPGVGKAFKDGSSPLEDYAHHVDDAARNSHHAAGATKEHGDAAKTAAGQIDDETSALQNYSDTVFGIIDADDAYTKSVGDLGAAIDDYNAKQLIAIAATGTDVPQANKDAQDSLLALHDQIEATARAASAKAIADAGPNLSAQQQSTLGLDAYRTSLLGAANSAIPAVQRQAIILLGQLQTIGAQHPDPTIDINTGPAHQKLNDLQAHWDRVTHAMGPVGPQGP